MGYASFAAYHMTTESSLVELNGILKSPIGMDRFRANVVIGGTEPFAEVCYLNEFKFPVSDFFLCNYTTTKLTIYNEHQYAHSPYCSLYIT